MWFMAKVGLKRSPSLMAAMVGEDGQFMSVFQR